MPEHCRSAIASVFTQSELLFVLKRPVYNEHFSDVLGGNRAFSEENETLRRSILVGK